MREWEKVQLGQIAEFSNGVNFDKTAYTNGVKLIGVANFGNRFYPDYDELTEVKKEAVRAEDYLQDGDIIFVRSNGNKELVGRCMLICNPEVPVTFSGFCIRARLKNLKKYDPLFFTYHFKNVEFRKAISGSAVGANIQNLSQGRLNTYIATIPDIDTQHRIAGVLSKYDDLIENNQRQIKLLEEAAQRLYKEWFVDLRFPGHEQVPVVDGVPEGWKTVSLGMAGCTLETGSRPKGGIDAGLKTGVASIGAENVIGLGQYNFSAEKLVTQEFFDKMKRGILHDRDILIYKDGAYIGKTSLFQDGFPHQQAAVNEHVFLLHMLDESLQYYVFFTLYQDEYYMKMQKLNRNAAQPGINAQAMQSLQILIPTCSIIQKFDAMVNPIMGNIFSLAKESTLLSEARDRLLPKLMSGEIAV